MKNEAESLTYNTEKQLKENDAKLNQEVKDRVRSDITSVNEAIASNNSENLKNSLEKLRNSAMEIGRAIYAGAQGESSQSDSTQQESNQESTSEENKNENK